MDNASVEQRRNLAVHAIRRLTQLDGLTDAAETELLPAASRTLRLACADPVRVEIDTLGDWIAAWETAHIHRDEDTADVLLAAMCGLTCWYRFRQSGTEEPIAAMALTLLELAGFDSETARLDNSPLTDPRVIDQFHAIAALLTPTDDPARREPGRRRRSR
ncbi:hypothetical protein [Prescottella equi]|uniref:hypothetical protein n=1 Tax=Rhodococcus hoagii TaxID=43767 RepID=UPI00301B6D74